ncbi:DUF4178 domain-containing protein [Luteipulveratus flavus]|uniref:DUF4178 domain-containing protein n=1 Tax=Luteipulveratus flavus TaxID=3031728 RepID=A0ABT6C969_9MICO|nr:DUF4178 domain-containing protein [Luteipulveratus sp. YIM 133296]MDF8265345.1 DUF4178 domain-containing protein [Luteipulveratus sp. YIM 133296]
MSTGVPLTELAPGVVVRIHGRSTPIVASVWLEQDDVVWSEHLLQDAGLGQQWLSVEEDDGLVLTSWTPRPDLVGEPDGRWVRMDGRRWRRYENGEANFMVEGSLPYGKAGRCTYADYRSDDQRLSFERFGFLPWEISVGHRLPTSAVSASREA